MDSKRISIEIPKLIDRISGLSDWQTKYIEQKNELNRIHNILKREHEALLKTKLDIENYVKTFLDGYQKKEDALYSTISIKEGEAIKQEQILRHIYTEKSAGFPALSKAIADFYFMIDSDLAAHLKYKSNPALKAAEKVKEIAYEKRLLQQKYKIAYYFVSFYESMFPWITEYVGENIDDLLNALLYSKSNYDNLEVDPVRKYLTEVEYDQLTEAERNQKALDRYLSSRKKPWHIGRDYERYVGYLYEKKGYKVEYFGIKAGLEDLGRDLICIKDGITEIVQCKCWANTKIIHENHINQLYGTAVKYYIDEYESYITRNQGKTINLFPNLMNSGERVATIYTSTKLSETARKFSLALGINYFEDIKLEKYPIIKCNISADGEQIYHLPFDQQYDKTMINKSGEFYAMTVAEAMNRGFRRAFKWSGNS